MISLAPRPLNFQPVLYRCKFNGRGRAYRKPSAIEGLQFGAAPNSRIAIGSLTATPSARDLPGKRSTKARHTIPMVFVPCTRAMPEHSTRAFFLLVDCHRHRVALHDGTIRQDYVNRYGDSHSRRSFWRKLGVHLIQSHSARGQPGEERIDLDASYYDFDFVAQRTNRSCGAAVPVRTPSIVGPRPVAKILQNFTPAQQAGSGLLSSLASRFHRWMRW